MSNSTEKCHNMKEEKSLSAKPTQVQGDWWWPPIDRSYENPILGWNARVIWSENTSGHSWSLVHDRMSFSGYKDIVENREIRQAFSAALNEVMGCSHDFFKRVVRGFSADSLESKSEFEEYWRWKKHSYPELYQHVRDQEMKDIQSLDRFYMFLSRKRAMGQVIDPSKPGLIDFVSDGPVSSSDEATFKVFDDGLMMIQASPRGSCGHLYLNAYLKHDADLDNVSWSGNEIPPVGSKVRTSVDFIDGVEKGTRCTVLAYWVSHRFLHLVALPEKREKSWHDKNRSKMNRSKMFPRSTLTTLMEQEYEMA